MSRHIEGVYIVFGWPGARFHLSRICSMKAAREDLPK
jgi:hypothetical protein